MTHLHLEVGTFCCELGQLVEQVAQLSLGLSEGGEDLPGAGRGLDEGLVVGEGELLRVGLHPSQLL